MTGRVEQVLQAGDTALVAYRWQMPRHHPRRHADPPGRPQRGRAAPPRRRLLGRGHRRPLRGRRRDGPIRRIESRRRDRDPREPRLSARQGVTALERAAPGRLHRGRLPRGQGLIRIRADPAPGGGRAAHGGDRPPRPPLQADDDHDGPSLRARRARRTPPRSRRRPRDTRAPRRKGPPASSPPASACSPAWSATRGAPLASGASPSCGARSNSSRKPAPDAARAGTCSPASPVPGGRRARPRAPTASARPLRGFGPR